MHSLVQGLGRISIQDLRQFFYSKLLFYLLLDELRDEVPITGLSYFLVMEPKALVHLVSVEKDGIFVSTRPCAGLRPAVLCRWDRWALIQGQGRAGTI